MVLPTILKASQLKRVSDYIDAKLDPWPELDKVQLSQILGQEWVLAEAKVCRVRTQYNPDPDGRHEAAFLKLVVPDTGEAYNLLVSQVVLVDKCKQLLAQEALPCLGVFSKEGAYYSLD